MLCHTSFLCQADGGRSSRDATKQHYFLTTVFSGQQTHRSSRKRKSISEKPHQNLICTALNGWRGDGDTPLRTVGCEAQKCSLARAWLCAHGEGTTLGVVAQRAMTRF